MSSTIRRPETDLYFETYGTRWSDDPALAHVFQPDADRTQRLLDADVARERDRLTEYDADIEESREWCAHHCPECCGSGLDVVYHSALRDWETGEFVDVEEVPCDACHGTGELTEPAGEPEVLPDADVWLNSYASQDYLPTSEE